MDLAIGLKKRRGHPFVVLKYYINPIREGGSRCVFYTAQIENLKYAIDNVNLKSKQTGALDIPVKITATSDASVKIVSQQPVQIKVEKAE